MQDQQIQDAIRAIGEYEPSADWKIAPQDHADQLPPEAAPLARILRRPELRALIERFNSADERAVKSQKEYKLFGRLAIIFNMLAILVGAFALFGQNLLGVLEHPPKIIPFFGEYVAGAQFIFVIGALIAAQLIIRLRPFEKWMHARAEAELSRIALFYAIADAQEPSEDGELPALPLQLEYFRRYQLGTQLAYYAGRGAQHQNAATKRASRRDIYTALGTFAAAPVAFFGLTFLDSNLGEVFGNYIESGDDKLLSSPVISQILSLTAIIASTLLATLSTMGLLSQDRRNASRYLTVYKNLEFLKSEYLDDAREAALAGDHDGMMEFIQSINDLISSEHKEWIALQEESNHPDFATIAATRLPILHKRRGVRSAASVSLSADYRAQYGATQGSAPLKKNEDPGRYLILRANDGTHASSPQDAEIFVSYSRVDRDKVAQLVKVVEAQGWAVWWDPEIIPGQQFDEQIDAKLESAKCVVVVWSQTSVKSAWVRGEARDGLERGILVPLKIDQCKTPIDFRAVQTEDLSDWN